MSEEKQPYTEGISQCRDLSRSSIAGEYGPVLAATSKLPRQEKRASQGLSLCSNLASRHWKGAKRDEMCDMWQRSR